MYKSSTPRFPALLIRIYIINLLLLLLLLVRHGKAAVFGRGVLERNRIFYDGSDTLLDDLLQ